MCAFNMYYNPLAVEHAAVIAFFCSASSSGATGTICLYCLQIERARGFDLKAQARGRCIDSLMWQQQSSLLSAKT